MRNRAVEGRFFQTIHTGYDDAWTWSGHRAPTLLLAAGAYRLAPSAGGLSALMLLGALLGAVPAALVGRRAAGGAAAGLVAGGLAWLGAPAVMAVALQDYQDLVFALPALAFCWWAMGAGRPALALLGAVACVLPREEVVPMGLVAALLVPPRRGGALWLWGGAVQAGVALGVAAGWTAVSTALWPLSSGHDMPLENAVSGIFTGERAIFLDGWEFRQGFYGLLAVPFGALLLLGPEALLPALGLVLLHMTVPVGHGVDRSWTGHAHHMAPAAAFAALAAATGAGRLLRLFGRAADWHPRAPAALQALGLGLMVLVAGRAWRTWADDQNLRVALWPTSPVWEHPAWALARGLPAGAVPITSMEASLVLSGFSRSYTYDSSLAARAPQQGLAAGTHLICDADSTDVLAWAMAMPGAREEARVGGWVRVAWDRGPDPGWAARRGGGFVRPPPELGPFPSRAAIPGVPPFSSGQRLSAPAPRLWLPWGAP